MAIDLKNKSLAAAYYGSKTIKEIYKGGVKIWPEEEPEPTNYTYQYSGNNYVTAKCYYKDADGNLSEQAVPNTGGNACLVLDYSVGVNRYVDGVFVDEVAITYGATLEALDYMTFAGDECEWWEETASPLSDWTHNIQYLLGEDVVRGASVVDMTFGEAPVPFVTKDSFIAVQFSNIKIKLPAGILEGLRELTLECSDVASLYQEYRSYGDVSKVTWQIRNFSYTLDGVAPGGTINLSSKGDSDIIQLILAFDMKCVAEFGSGHTEESDWYNTGGVQEMDCYDYGEFSSLGSIEIDDRYKDIYNLNEVLREWTALAMKGDSRLNDTIETHLGITFYVGKLAEKYACNEVIDVDGTETAVTQEHQIVYPDTVKSWKMN